MGLAPQGRYNPMGSARMPFTRSLLGRALVEGEPIVRNGLLLKGIDACLEVPGPPQSATGQTALFTGINASKAIGYHLPAYPDERCAAILEEHSVLKMASQAGLRASFANAYTRQYFADVEKGRLAHSATTLAVLAAGLRFRLMNDLRRGDAVYWDITNHTLQGRIKNAPPVIEPEKAGKNLAILSRSHDLLLFECFTPDLIGHRRDALQAVEWLNRLDRFLSATVRNLDAQTTMVISSDHGNLERLDIVAHSRNPVPLLAVGPRAGAFGPAKSITDVTPIILDILLCREIEHLSPSSS